MICNVTPIPNAPPSEPVSGLRCCLGAGHAGKHRTANLTDGGQFDIYWEFTNATGEICLRTKCLSCHHSGYTTVQANRDCMYCGELCPCSSSHGAAGYADGSRWSGYDIVCGECGEYISNPTPTGSRWVSDRGFWNKLRGRGKWISKWPDFIGGVRGRF